MILQTCRSRSLLPELRHWASRHTLTLARYKRTTQTGWRFGSSPIAAALEGRAGQQCQGAFVSLLVSAMGDRRNVRVADDGGVVGLWRRGYPQVSCPWTAK